MQHAPRSTRRREEEKTRSEGKKKAQSTGGYARLKIKERLTNSKGKARDEKPKEKRPKMEPQIDNATTIDRLVQAIYRRGSLKRHFEEAEEERKANRM